MQHYAQILIAGCSGAGEQRRQIRGLWLDQPEAAQVIVEILQDLSAPGAARLVDILAQYRLQMAAVRSIVSPVMRCRFTSSLFTRSMKLLSMSST